MIGGLLTYCFEVLNVKLKVAHKGFVVDIRRIECNQVKRFEEVSNVIDDNFRTFFIYFSPRSDIPLWGCRFLNTGG